MFRNNVKVEINKEIAEIVDKYIAVVKEKLVKLITNDKKYPQKKVNRIVGAIRVKKREKVS